MKHAASSEVQVVAAAAVTGEDEIRWSLQVKTARGESSSTTLLFGFSLCQHPPIEDDFYFCRRFAFKKLIPQHSSTWYPNTI